jgi:antitoxin component YwqK of YwqJK toxin-antitoxin module
VPAPVVVFPSAIPQPIILTQAPGFGVGVGVGSGGVRVGGSVAPSGDVIRDSVINGAVLGSAGGPIGAAIGAGVGLLHGLWAKRQVEQAAKVEAARQKEADRKLEEELASQQPGSSTTDTGTTGTTVASLPPTTEPAEPPRDRLDPDGFRPVYDGGRLVRRERIGADGRATEVVHYDAQGQIVRRDESSRRDGRFDTSTFYADGKPQRRESDTDADGTVDLWATYDAAGEVARLESLADGRRHTQVYTAGRMSEEEWRRAADGTVTRRVKYEDGTVREKLDGNLLTYFEPNGDVAREAELDANGRPTMIAYYEGGRLVRRELYEIDDKAFQRVPLVSPETAAEVTR